MISFDCVEKEEVEEGFQVVTPRGILQRSINNDLVPVEATIVALQAIIVVVPAFILDLL